MKLNLRKSSAIQAAINEQINSTELPTSVTLTRYDLPVEKTAKTEATFAEGLQKKRDLFGVLVSLRKKTAASSERAGVSDCLAEMAHLDKMILILSPLAKIKDFLKNGDALQSVMDDLKKETTQQAQYGYNKRDSFEASVITERQTKEFQREIADMKREKQGLSDRLLEVNVKNEIEVSEQEEAILKKYGIL